MEISLTIRMAISFFSLSLMLIAFFPDSSHSATVFVDGVANSKTPTVHIGDSIIFRHKNHYSLYIFRNKLAFNLCNFTQATLLSNPNSSSYTWKPSRLGNFYFSFNNGTKKPCLQGQKLAVKVIMTPAPAPAISPVTVTEPPTPGGVASSSPAFPWPFRPREKSGGPSSSPAPVAMETTAMAPVVSGGVGGAVPFIDSNPAIPLPTGEVDSDTIHPLPTSANNNHALPRVQAKGILGFLISQCITMLLML